MGRYRSESEYQCPTGKNLPARTAHIDIVVLTRAVVCRLLVRLDVRTRDGQGANPHRI
jgi:hypothetical protein